MSTSVFKGARAYSFLTTQGGVGFVWAEHSYDESDGPEAASWDVMAIGSRERIVQRIFKVAANLPGGSTKVRHNSPNSFISAMLERLSAPVRLDDSIIELTNAYDATDQEACVRASNRSLVVELLSRHGLEDAAIVMAEARSAGGMSVQLDLADHLTLVEDLVSQDLVIDGEVRKNAGIQPWRLMRSLPMGHGHGPVPEQFPQTRPKAPKVQMFKANVSGDGYGLDRHFSCWVDSEFYAFDQPWAIERSLICRAAEAEAKAPGYFGVLLSAYEAARDSHGLLPGDTLIKFDACGADNYYRLPLHALSAKALGGSSDQFTMSIDDFGRFYGDLGRSNDETWNIKYKLLRTLSQSQFVSFELPEQETENQSSSVAFERPRG